MQFPKVTDQWVVTGTKGFDSLEHQKDVPIPAIGEFDCLVRITAVSLNFRDLAITQGAYPFPHHLPVIPCSDGTGEVLHTGPRVTSFTPGDKVCVHFNQGHQSGPLTPDSVKTGLGGSVDGTLRTYGVFPETGLVMAPSNLSSEEAATLSCAPLTAWNALFGLESKAIRPGDCVLTQGTGGVSVSAVQFARAAGATVIATTSLDEKAEILKKLGANVVVNYKTDKEWGKAVKKASPGGLGCDHVIELGGPATMRQSMQAVKMEGVITLIGALGGGEADESGLTLETLLNVCTVRGVVVGSRAQFKDMIRCIEANDIHPVVDKAVFSFEQAREAYQYQWDQKHIGKVVIRVGWH